MHTYATIELSKNKEIYVYEKKINDYFKRKRFGKSRTNVKRTRSFKVCYDFNIIRKIQTERPRGVKKKGATGMAHDYISSLIIIYGIRKSKAFHFSTLPRFNPRGVAIEVGTDWSSDCD